jgi:hypothetical protein
VPQFIGDRFYSESASLRWFALLVASITYIIGQMTGVRIAFSRFFGVYQEHHGIYVGMAIVFVHACWWRRVPPQVMVRRVLAYTVSSRACGLAADRQSVPPARFGLKPG